MAPLTASCGCALYMTMPHYYYKEHRSLDVGHYPIHTLQQCYLERVQQAGRLRSGLAIWASRQQKGCERYGRGR